MASILLQLQLLHQLTWSVLTPQGQEFGFAVLVSTHTRRGGNQLSVSRFINLLCIFDSRGLRCILEGPLLRNICIWVDRLLMRLLCLLIGDASLRLSLKHLFSLSLLLCWAWSWSCSSLKTPPWALTQSRTAAAERGIRTSYCLLPATLFREAREVEGRVVV